MPFAVVVVLTIIGSHASTNCNGPNVCNGRDSRNGCNGHTNCDGNNGCEGYNGYITVLDIFGLFEWPGNLTQEMISTVLRSE